MHGMHTTIVSETLLHSHVYYNLFGDATEKEKKKKETLFSNLIFFSSNLFFFFEKKKTVYICT